MKQSVLVIDDDEDDYIFIKESLLQVGCRFPVYFAKSGEECFKFLNEVKQNLPTLIILDLNMPKMNGMEVLKRIDDEYGVPVILYTALVTEEIIQKAKSMRALDCVKKGTSFSDNLKFAKRVVQLLRNLN